MRLFIAVQLSDELKNILTGTLHELKKAGVKGNYVPSQNLHLTLVFIGETKDVEKIKEAMKTVAFQPFRLSLSEMGHFDDLLWAGMKGGQKLSFLVKGLREALDQAGIDYGKQEFMPHITIIRRFSGNWKNVPAPKGDMMVKKISLMKSEQKDGKRVYTEIAALK